MLRNRARGSDSEYVFIKNKLFFFLSPVSVGSFIKFGDENVSGSFHR